MRSFFELVVVGSAFRSIVDEVHVVVLILVFLEFYQLKWGFAFAELCLAKFRCLKELLKEEGALQPKQEKSSSYANNLLKDTRSHIRPGRALLGKKQKKWRSSDEYFQSLICGSEVCLVGLQHVCTRIPRLWCVLTE